jgi:nitroreductase
MPNLMEKTLSQTISERRTTPSFDAREIPDEDLKKILEAGLQAPSGFNMQPWRFVVVRSEEQKKKLRLASFNQANVEEAAVVIAVCADADGWRNGDLEEMLRLGREGGMPETYAAQAQVSIPHYLANHPNLTAWLYKQTMIAFTYMMLMAEALGYDTAATEGFDEDKIREALKLPLSYRVPALLSVGYLRGDDNFNSGRFSMARTVFEDEYGTPMKL